jgi:hypothetical protein
MMQGGNEFWQRKVGKLPLSLEAQSGKNKKYGGLSYQRPLRPIMENFPSFRFFYSPLHDAAVSKTSHSDFSATS